MGQTREQKIIKQLSNPASVQKRTAIATDMFLPNHSGIKSHPEFKDAIGDFVPYTGASSNVNLGNNIIYAGNAEITPPIDTSSSDVGNAVSGTKNIVTNSHILTGTPASASQSTTGLTNTITSKPAHTAQISTMLFTEDTAGISNTVNTGARTITASDGALNPVFSTYGINNLINSNALTFNNPDLGAQLTINLYGIKNTVQSLGMTQTAGTLFVNSYGEYIYVQGSSGGTSTAYGLFINGVTAADTKWAIYNNGASGTNNFLGKDNVKTYFGTGFDALIYYSGSHLIIDPNGVGTGTVKIGVTANDTIDAGAYKIGGTSAVADGTYNTGIGPLGNMGTITTKSGIITAITQAT